MKLGRMIVGIGVLSVMGVPMFAEASDSKSITLKQIGRYSAGASTVPDEPRAEIAVFDAKSKRLFSINLNLRQLDVLDLSSPESPVLVQAVPLGGKPNSVAVHDGIVAVAVEGPVKTDPGTVKFFNVSGALLNTLTVGSLPDMLVFSPNGKWLLVANEGEPSSYNNNPVPSVDPEGSVSIIEMRRDVSSLTQLNVRTATFSATIPQENPSSIRIYGPNATFAQDIEPEYITVSHNSKTAWVTLQENNAIGILDIPSATFTKIVGLGFKDYSLPGNGFDASDRDVPGSSNSGIINIRNWPVLGMYEPDAIASYRVKGETYLVTANEGDTRDYPPGFTEEARVGSLTLDAAAFAAQGYADVTTGAAGLRNNDNLGRLTVTNANGAKELDADAEFERLYVPGGRSFSIRRADGTLVYDSGDELEQRTATLIPTLFNSQGDAATFDTRSDNKGPEPEGLAIGKVSGRTYAFIGLERTGGVMVYDISKPTAPTFVTYVTTAPVDLSPEGLFFIKKKDSPNGKPLLVVSHEVSNTVAIFEIVTDSREEEDGDVDDETVLVSQDYALPGDGLLTRDKVSGLDWLDVTKTVNQTYDQVRTGPYYTAGFHHATKAEVETLFLHAGMPYDPVNPVTTFLNEARNLARLVGVTISVPDQGRESTYGFTGTDFFGNTVTTATHPIGIPFSAQLGKIDYLPSINLGEAHFSGGHPFSNEAGLNYGSFLVRPASRR